MKFNISRGFLITIITGVVVLSYISIKAYVSSFTFDESFTYLSYVHDSYFNIFYSYANSYTNNHVLNSLLMKLSEQVFGSSEIALRLPNLLLFIVYLVYGYLLFRKTKPIISISVFVLLCTNSVVIDFFGLARGYGLSFGFMLMCIYHLLRSLQSNKTKHLVFFHIGALLAVLSNFTLLVFYTSSFVVFILINFIDCKLTEGKRYNIFKENKIHFYLFLMVSLILYIPVVRVINTASFDFGGKSGFYSETVTHIINYILHSKSQNSKLPELFVSLSPWVLIFAKILITCITIGPLIIIIKKALKKDKVFWLKFKGLVVTNLLLVFISFVIILQHYILGTDYPILRFSVFISIIFIIYSGFLLHYLAQVVHIRFVQLMAVSLAVLSILSFTSKADLRSCAEWEYDMETKNAISKLVELHDSDSSDSEIKYMRINWVFNPTMNYYIQTLGINWLIPVTRDEMVEDYDYYYIFKSELPQLNPQNYEVISEYERIGTILLKIVNPISPQNNHGKQAFRQVARNPLFSQYIFNNE